ncbi:MAG: response regulator transcription factor [Clostridium thermopalmarium]|uniref:LytR/AlgR family response regulator transcription factor n=1 Tax=Clostridium thermopalmarium TaxID=29373 RepID=UPI0023575C34|nr:LytTR family DNA-binding domain-containing protein [Clostridium thermopalmarium]MBE6043419.1 response regulator transcription factor [Clostridium thermopalmarium]
MNCIIVDDEYPAREELKHFINEFSSIVIEAEFDDSIKALEYIEKNKPDIIFLDINMPKLDGMALGRIINNFEEKIDVVFITAHKEYAVDAFEVEAFDYILKPYSEERIMSTLKRLEKSRSDNDVKYVSNKMTLKKDNKLKVIEVSDICYCEASERETIIYTSSNRYTEHCSISEFYKRLPKEHFFRTHRSYIVNLDKITEIIPWFNNTYMIKLKGIDEEIPVSRNNINNFKQLMGI